MIGNENLEAEFHEAMLQLYEDAKRLDIYAEGFRKMVKELGGVRAASNLLSQGNPWTETQLASVTELMLAPGGRENLKYTVEALVLKPRFVFLFDNKQREKACQRLKALDPSWEC